MDMIVCCCILCWLLLTCRTALTSIIGSGSGDITPTMANIDLKCGDLQYLNSTGYCNDLPEVFDIIFNQTNYSTTLNESSAISGIPLIYFTIYVQGSVIDNSITKSLVVAVVSTSGASSFTLNPNSVSNSPLMTYATDPVPSVFVVNGMIWIAPNSQPQPGVYILTLSASLVLKPMFISKEATANITLLETNPCDLNPCTNGVCSKSGVINFTCACPPNYTGNICDIPYNPCDDNPCNNGGDCSSDSNGFVCECKDGFTGPTCTLNFDDCIEANCGNGTCHDLVAGYTCVCLTGYTGEHCQTNIDDCASGPCLHGQCRDLVSGFYCDCGKPLTVTQCNSASTIFLTTTLIFSSPSPSSQTIALSQNCVVINLVFAVLLITTTVSLVCLIVIIITLAWRLKTKSNPSSIVDSSVVINARPSFGEEEKDAYIEMFEQMV